MLNYGQTGNNENGVLTSFSQIFEARLRHGYFHINQLFPQIFFKGDSYVLRQSDYPQEADVGERSTVGTKTPINTVALARRVLTTKKISYSVAFASEDLAVTGFNPGSSGVYAADACQKSLDRICVKAMTDDVQVYDDNPIPYNKKMIIPYDYGKEYYSDALDPEGQDAASNLTGRKINMAMTMMESNNVRGNVVCLLNPVQKMNFRADKFVRNTDFNIQPAMATGVTGPYDGLSQFITTNLLPQNVKTIKPSDNTKVDHVYVICPDYFLVGTNLPWEFKEINDPVNGYDYGVYTQGKYGAVRKHEAAVIVIETKHVDIPTII